MVMCRLSVWIYNETEPGSWQDIGPATVLSQSVADGGGIESEEWNQGDISAPIIFDSFWENTTL